MSARPVSIEVRYGWVVVFASLAINTVALGAPTVLFVALKPIAADFDWPRSVPSLAYSLMMLGAGVGGLAMGWWTDRRGVFGPVLFGSLMIGLGALLASQTEGRWSFYVANGVLVGLLGKAAMIAPMIANVTRWFDRRRGLAIAVIASGQGIAGAIWPPILRWMNDAVGWRGTYFWFGCFALATMLPLALFLRRPAPIPPLGHGPTETGADGRVLGLPASAVQGLLWLAVVGCCTTMSMPIVHLVSHATDLGHTPARGAEMLSLLFASAFVSRVLFGLLADRIGGVPTLLIGSAGQASMVLAFAFVDGLVGLYMVAFLFGLGFAGIMPCYALVIRQWFPAGQAGWRIASQYMFGALGMALGGWLGGAVYDHTGGYAPAFLVGFGFNAVNLATIGVLHLRATRLRLSPALA